MSDENVVSLSEELRDEDLSPQKCPRDDLFERDGSLKQSYLNRIITPSIVASVVHTEKFISASGYESDVDVPIMSLYPDERVWVRERGVKVAEIKGALTRIPAEQLSTESIVEVCMRIGTSPFIMPATFLPDGPRQNEILQLIQTRRKEIAVALEALGSYYIDDVGEMPLVFETEDHVNQLIRQTTLIWQNMNAADRIQRIRKREDQVSKYPWHLLQRHFLDWEKLIDSDGKYYPRNHHNENLRLVSGVLSHYGATSLSWLKREMDFRIYPGSADGSNGRHSRPGYIVN